MLKKLSIWNK